MLLSCATQPILPVYLIEQTSMLSQSGLDRRGRVITNASEPVRLAPCV